MKFSDRIYDLAKHLDSKKAEDIVLIDVSSVTVVADNGALADALSTVCFLLGYEASLPLLSRYHAEAVFQATDGTLSVTDGLRDGFEAAS